MPRYGKAAAIAAKEAVLTGGMDDCSMQAPTLTPEIRVLSSRHWGLRIRGVETSIILTDLVFPPFSAVLLTALGRFER